jgi:hypothetical protein
MNYPDSIPALHSAASDQEFSPRFHEVYEIVSIVELVHNMRVYRIEILKSYSESTDPFSSCAYRREDEDGNQKWQRLEIGWVRRDSVDSALAQTIGFLRSITHKSC